MNWELLLKLIISQGRYKGQRDDYDHDLGLSYGIDYDLDHMQDIDTGNGHDGDECLRSMSSLFWQMSSLLS